MTNKMRGFVSYAHKHTYFFYIILYKHKRIYERAENSGWIKYAFDACKFICESSSQPLNIAVLARADTFIISYIFLYKYRIKSVQEVYCLQYINLGKSFFATNSSMLWMACAYVSTIGTRVIHNVHMHTANHIVLYNTIPNWIQLPLKV